MVEKKKQAQFLPWSAINAFMLPDFQLEVLSDVLGHYELLTSEQRSSLNQMIKKGVKVNGFRNAIQAPLMIRARGSVELFEKNAHFAYLVLSSWCSLYPALREAIHQFLTERGWLLLPHDTDRSVIPGFLTQWPKEDEFEVLTPAFRERFPEMTEVSDNQISLMEVWLSGRLPYELVEMQVIAVEENTDSQDAL
ncbi:MAG: hypothetical protein HPY85_05840 [Anaerolineae bacterium]|nr:hypothetical protein [Anaerolineae bacterium]